MPATRQNALIAVGLAIAVALAGAVLWGLVAMLFNLQLSLIGLLIGAGVGAVVAKYRPRHRPTIIAGAVIAVAGCALGTLLAMVFKAMKAHFALSFILAHLGGPYGLLHFYPSNVGILGLLFWAVAAVAAVRIPLQSQRTAAGPAAVTPVWGQTPNAAAQAGDLPPESAQPMFVQPAEPESGPSEPGPAAGPSPAT
ncbi:MAG: hypothetical protein ACLQFR_18335 [Streptosporangiaceae bacterium]